MKIFADYHMHTKYSDGRASIAEMYTAARAKGLEEIAITDHGPRNIGTGVSGLQTYQRIKKELQELNRDGAWPKALAGAEADVIGRNGDIDVPEKTYRELDVLLVGLHPYVWPASINDGLNLVVNNQLQKYSAALHRKVANDNTKALVECMYRHPVTAITHPGLGMPIDIPEVARACAQTETAYEVNTGHDFQSVEELKIASREGTNFILNSDAHFTDTVGDLEKGLELLLKAEVTPERILNVRL
ncbi:MAG: PHP domain-containing protein [Bacillota bacterium]